MTSIAHPLAAALPHLQPHDAAGRLLLFGIRQMGAHGLNDAACAHAFVTAFGKDFRRPLVLLRTLMHEMSQAAAGPIQIAPWCCRRMTAGEAALLTVLRRIDREPDAAALLLSDLLGVREPASVAVSAHLLASAFSDLGLPLR
ncbi:DUF6628 family protein [Sphingomonas baiyangensis]|uniref:Uncharacterized protein n=1 Tax=Sphingomonas baiyangensis TaxID=2572576 RepID=A0A4U1L3T2_9SPHN|nr:DUF6628 family protein [Sphingomonas baiyangensis]TKD50786.1 hypothetical protein FBR43_08390 [Sphingomonas baiyangensis]